MNASAADESILDNPVWSALAGPDDAYALGGDRARRYRPDIYPFAGVAEPRDASAWARLAEIPADGPTVVLSASPVPGWQEVAAFPLCQLVYRHSTPPPITGAFPLTPLGLQDADEMVALTQLADPGPFERCTVQLGGYRGIRVDGELVSMAGEGIHPAGWTEINSVCTNPRFQGQGMAAQLVSALVADVLAAGRRPFLHVADDNDGARRLYERLGFVTRAVMTARVIRRPAD